MRSCLPEGNPDHDDRSDAPGLPDGLARPLSQPLWRGAGLLLTPVFALLLVDRWSRIQAGAGFDPTSGWLQRFSAGLGGWTAILAVVGTAALAGFTCLYRVRNEPASPDEPARFPDAWTAYVVVQMTALLWTILCSQVHPGVLTLQFLHSFWLLAGLYMFRHRLRWSLRPGWWRWGLAAYAMALAGAVLYGYVVHAEPSVNPAVDWFVHSRGVERVGWLLLLCVLTPILEEAWYRGLLSGPSRVRNGLVAAFFAVVHADPSALAPLMWLGLVFGWARWRGSLPSAVLAHALWNTTVAVWLLGGLKG